MGRVQFTFNRAPYNFFPTASQTTLISIITNKLPHALLSLFRLIKLGFAVIAQEHHDKRAKHTSRRWCDIKQVQSHGKSTKLAKSSKLCGGVVTV